MHRDARLLGEPTERPNVVVANKEVYVNTLVCDLFERLQERTVLLLALIAPEVLAPEVKYISKQVDGGSILSHALQHVNQGLLMG